MTDSLFWELTYKYSWWYGSTTLHFGGKPGEVGLLVRGEEDEPITNAQKEAYLLFDRIWGGEDWDDNGVAVAFLNEKIEEISYKNIAY